MILQIGKRGLRQKQSNLSGFTLIEILLVVVIVTIVISIATPQFRKTLITLHLSNTTQDIAQFMRFLKVKALAERSTYQLKFDLTAKKYFAQNVTGGKSITYNTPRPIPENINIASTVNPVNFYPDGSIDKVSIFLFIGKGDYFKDLDKAINKDFELGQIQSITHTENVYTITTKPTIGRVEVTTPE